jgi:hypothetical protein
MSLGTGGSAGARGDRSKPGLGAEHVEPIEERLLDDVLTSGLDARRRHNDAEGGSERDSENCWHAHVLAVLPREPAPTAIIGGS